MKRVADTSRDAYETIARTLGARAADVLEALRRYAARHGSDPTAYELLRWMQVDRPALDLNAVRPRLTELKDAGRVRMAAKRRCTVTNKRVYTWQAAPLPAHAISTHEQAKRPPAVQAVLF